MAGTKVESIYPLTSMQQNLLLHSTQSTFDQGFLQVKCDIEGKIDTSLLNKCWQDITDRHQMLRCSAHWEKIEKPVLVIHEKSIVPFDSEDIKNHENPEKAINNYLLHDREKGFDFVKAPISRVKVFEGANNQNLLVWSCHHLILDGWSAAVIIKEVFQLYGAQINDTQISFEAVPIYKDYLKLIKTRKASIHQHWKDSLEGMKSYGLISKSAKVGLDIKKQSFYINEKETTELNAFARKNKTTVNTLIHAYWGLILSKLFKHNEVAFGYTTSGRSLDLANIENMSGMFMNVLPAWIKLDNNQGFAEWIQDLFQELNQNNAHEHINLDEIYNLLGRYNLNPLFDTLLVFENFPWSPITAGNIEVNSFESGLTSTYPLTVIVKPGDLLEISFQYDPDRLPQEFIAWLENSLYKLLTTSLQNASIQIGELINCITETDLPISLDQENEINTIKLGEDTEYTAPTTETEFELVRIWETILKINPIGITDDFFEIGGKSIHAVGMFSWTERVFGKNVPPATLLQNPTIQQLAKVFKEEAGVNNEWSSLVPLRKGGTRPAVFCTHAGGGHVLFYKNLVKHLDPQFPVYGIQPLGLDGSTDYHSSINEMAKYYIDEMKKAQPEGPYALIGTCFSNAVCLEIAHLLKKQGDKISLLSFIDSYPFFMGDPEPSNETRVKNFVKLLKQGQYGEIIKKLSNQFKPKKEKSNVHAFEGGQFRRLRDMKDSLNKVYIDYKWEPYEGKITWIRSKENAENKSKDFHIARWKSLGKGGLDIHVVDGHHETLFEEPEVQGLAAQLNECLLKETVVS